MWKSAMIDSLATHSNGTARGASRERGVMLALVVLLMLPLIVLCGTILGLGSRQLAEEDSAQQRSRALLNAESGLDKGLAQLLADGDNYTTLQESDDDGYSVRYHVEFTPLGEDDLDNDGDGSVDETDEAQMVRLDSRGALNVASFDAEG